MWFFSWLRRRTPSRPAQGRTPRRPAAALFHPRLEELEDRWLPSQLGLTVSSLADSGLGTLRCAVLTANAGSHSDKFTISFGVTGTIDLQTPLPDLNNTIAIQGPGATSLTIERAAGASFASAIVTVDAGQRASLAGLTIAHGSTGGIENDGTLTVANCAVVNNSSFFGGGINNIGGTLTVSDSTLAGNSATGSGGGIASGFGATVTVTGSTLTCNSADVDGGAIDNDHGALTITSSSLHGNSAGGFGGGIASFDGATLTVTDSTLTCNSATTGGGIWNGARLTVVSSTLSANSATAGGAIYNWADSFDRSSVTVRDSVFTANSATEGGGTYNEFFGTLTVQGSTLTGNTAGDSGGGLYNLGTATVQQITLSGNTAGSAGGGTFNGASGTLAVKDSTALNNVAPLGADLYNSGALTLDDSTLGVIGP
jgi:hypothetical protein